MTNVKVIKAIKNNHKWQLAYDKEENILLDGLGTLLRIHVPKVKVCYILYADQMFPEVGIEYISFMGSGTRIEGVNTARYEYIDKKKRDWMVSVPFEILNQFQFIPPKIYFKVITV